MRFAALISSVVLMAAGCSRPIKTARMSDQAPLLPEEAEAKELIAGRACSPYLSLLFPGLGQACLRQPGKAAFMASLAAAELGATIAVSVETESNPLAPEPDDNPAALYGAVALQDLWAYSLVDTVFVGQRARQLRFVPNDSTTDLIAAPFNHQVMKKPAVWLGLAVALGVGIGASLAIDGADTDDAFEDPNLFGKTLDAEVGYPAGIGFGTALFSHVAIAEEALFRGFLQSAFARRWGEDTAWVAASVIFGGVHAANLTAIDEEDRAEYAAVALPIITAAGFYLGWVYRQEDYSLAAPVAIHFWYDLLLSASLFALSPQDSPFSARIAIPF